MSFEPDIYHEGITNGLVSKSVMECPESRKSTGLSCKCTVNNDGVAEYLGSLLSNHIQACLFKEKRERQIVTARLLVYRRNVDQERFRVPKDADVMELDFSRLCDSSLDRVSATCSTRQQLPSRSDKAIKRPDPASSFASANADVANGAPNDGHVVASSLAAGRRLSPGSEASGSSVQGMSAENQTCEMQAQNGSAAAS